MSGHILYPYQVEAIVKALDGISGDDPEAAHSRADEVLLAAMPAEVRDAYAGLMARCDWWASA